MQPGASRAIVFGIIGFVLGFAFVVVTRGLQGLTPVVDLGVSMIVAVFTSAGTFMWGIGAFNPRWSQHELHEEDEPPPLAIAEVEAESADIEEVDDGKKKKKKKDVPEIKSEAPPLATLGQLTWQLSTLMLLVIGFFALFAFSPNPLRLIEVAEANGSVHETGAIAMTLFGEEVLVNQAFVFFGFVAFTILSLVITGAIIAAVFYFVANGISVNQQREVTVKDRTPPLPARYAAKGAGWLRRKLLALPNALGQK